jgi:hypothetical protein
VLVILLSSPIPHVIGLYIGVSKFSPFALCILLLYLFKCWGISIVTLSFCLFLLIKSPI